MQRISGKKSNGSRPAASAQKPAAKTPESANACGQLGPIRARLPPTSGGNHGGGLAVATCFSLHVCAA